MISLKPAVLGVVAVLACGVPLHAARQSWTHITEKTTCEALSTDFCVGAFGFTIDPRGHWTAGPSASGQTAHGRLSPSEIKRLRRVALRVTRESDLGQTCVAESVVPGVSDQVTIDLADGTNVVVYRRGLPGGLCFAGNRDTATALHDLVNQIMQRRYPKPFH